MFHNPNEAAAVGHFNRREALEHLLESYSAPKTETVTVEQYKKWTPAKRMAFNDRRSARIAGSIVIETPSIRELKLECRRAAQFANRAVGRMGVILTGPATMGKTTAALRVMVGTFQRHVQRYPNWRELGHIPVVYIEIPSGANGKRVMGAFLDFFGEPAPNRMTLEERTRIVTSILTASNTSLVVFDEVQNLSGVSSHGRFEAAQSIKNLMNSVRSVPLYVGINLDKTAFTNNDLGAQFSSRSRLVKLGKLDISTPTGQSLWGGVIQGFERQFGLLNHPEKTLLTAENARYLHTRTRGSLGALSRLLSIAALDLIDADDPENERITIEQLEDIKLDLTTERELLGSKDNVGVSRRGKGARRAA
ncbi:TniB family NTP-binding protein [Microbacterium hydrocarbonoxydans]|uniref:TniB family NTP-binding protein n=1 Tax=Microbacterium hydrocarbonoxydans TaxID=273678 RepID=UPI002040A915|nr:TniB family NTP-binding protein [Microbacterium hydrocarbonoxydans]MCM3778804.1 TniB family NTP-binding protein [Microbacterium hydrocarbonoxydans]